MMKMRGKVREGVFGAEMADGFRSLYKWNRVCRCWAAKSGL